MVLPTIYICNHRGGVDDPLAGTLGDILTCECICVCHIAINKNCDSENDIKNHLTFYYIKQLKSDVEADV
jgi:hypothetical protein